MKKCALINKCGWYLQAMKCEIRSNIVVSLLRLHNTSPPGSVSIYWWSQLQLNIVIATLTLITSRYEYHRFTTRHLHQTDCNKEEPLGMASGQIQDWQITASSTFPKGWDKFCGLEYARLYQPNNYTWCSKFKTSTEWLQVDLGLVSKVSQRSSCTRKPQTMPFVNRLTSTKLVRIIRRIVRLRICLCTYLSICIPGDWVHDSRQRRWIGLGIVLFGLL